MSPAAAAGAHVPASARAARPLSILYVGCLGRSSRSSMIVRTLRELGHDLRLASAEVLDERGERAYFADPVWRVLSAVGRPPDRANVGASVLHLLGEGRFDLVWVTKSLSLRTGALRRALELSPRPRLAFYSEDDMSARHNQSVWFRRALPLFDVVFTTKSYNADPGELPALGARRVVAVDKSYDVHTHRPVPVTPRERAELGAEVGFAGTFEEPRALSLLRLAEAGVPVRVWGSHWERWGGKHPLLRVEGRALSARDYVLAVNATDVNLGFLRRRNRDLQTDRSVEIPACGAFLLAERTDEHRRLFEEGAEADFFSDDGELVDKVRSWLARPAERAAVARAGRERCLRGGYSFHDRLGPMLAVAAGEERA